jgi:hypothetical protein
MQGRADSLAFANPIAVTERPGVARPVDRSKRDHAESDPGPKQYARADADAIRITRRDSIELI